MANWLDRGRAKIEAVTYKTYCKGHDHCDGGKESRDSEERSSSQGKGKGKVGILGEGSSAAIGSGDKRGKRSKKKSLG